MPEQKFTKKGMIRCEICPSKNIYFLGDFDCTAEFICFGQKLLFSQRAVNYWTGGKASLQSSLKTLPDPEIDSMTPIYCKLDHQMVQLGSVLNLTITWHNLKWLQIWPLDGATCHLQAEIVNDVSSIVCNLSFFLSQKNCLAREKLVWTFYMFRYRISHFRE